jgi:hypothetical protein
VSSVVPLLLAAGDPVQILLASGVLLILVVIGGAVIFWARRQIKKPSRDEMAFSLSDLRRLRDEGKLSEEEYERARDSLLKVARGDGEDAR